MALSWARGQAGLVAVLLLTLGAAQLHAQTVPEPPAAVGRISYGAMFLPGSAICSGTLVAPDLVLTAGHCLRDGDAGAVRFAAGLGGQGAVAIARGAEILRPAAPEDKVSGPGKLAHDVALLRLDRAIGPDEVVPLRLEPRHDNQLRLVSYRRDDPGIRAEADCTLLVQNGGVLGLNCPVVSGNSGAPLMQPGPDGTWQVVAVMVAQNRTSGLLRSFAVEVPADLAARLPDQ